MMTGPQTPDPQVQRDGAVSHYRAGDLLIDVGRQRVIRDDRTIALPKLSFDLLVALARAAPNLVSSEALLRQVWPRAVVGPETLNQRVKLVRDALGDIAAILVTLKACGGAATEVRYGSIS